ncbi:MAG TPA: glycosyltransferase [Nocardioidaceae bacterium]|nr:glycosyltransferase [Nocardioidaceae bacterium]
MREVEIRPVPLDRLVELLTPERADRLAWYAEWARALLNGRTVWNISSTSRGGGVAEMLQTLLAYGRGARVDTRWLVLDGDRDFFTLTKRLHNQLHGSPGDGGDLGAPESDHYTRVLAYNLPMAAQVIRPGDIVLLHDPQPAGLAAGLRDLGAHVVWRCHIGRDEPCALSDSAWEFLRPHITAASGFIFSRREYVPPWLPQEEVVVIPPSIDPFSTKNAALTPAQTRAALGHAGLVSFGYDEADLGFNRRGGTRGKVRAHRGLVDGDGPIPAGARLVVQVSRWDALKDMSGVLAGFAEHLDDLPPDVHLALVGPDTSGVDDDPEGAAVLADCRARWSALDDAARRRTHLVSLPMRDVDENAHLVNALQQYAFTVVQKSLVEGFGLTVTEAMWKSKPVIASAVGGIQDQIEDGVHGLLLADPTDLGAYAKALSRVLTEQGLAESLGEAARDRVQERFLGDRHLIQYVDLFEALLQ